MNGFSVLMYHEIVNKNNFKYDNYKGICVQQKYDDKLPEPLFCYKEDFEKQMQYLNDNKYKTITIQDIKDFYYKDKLFPEKAVLLTFDDMYKSVYINAYPLLKKYGFHCVGFVVKDWVFNENQVYSAEKSVCMSKQELEMISDVFEFANHTTRLHTRNKKGTAFVTSDKEQIESDLLECEDFVSTKKVFAYPFGVYNDSSIELLKNNGYKLGFTSEDGYNTKETDPLKLKRNCVYLNMDILKFKNIL